jgi:uncharacterized protein (TIGR02001 family)
MSTRNTPTRLLAGASLFACAASAMASDLSGSGTLTSDYVWRGSTQTQGNPAAQAGLKLASTSGFYASAWGSNVDFNASDAHTELDLTVGWTRPLGARVALDTSIINYRYPGASGDLDWVELDLTATLDDRYWITLGGSTEALATHENGLYTQVGTRFPLARHLRLEAVLGHYSLGGPLPDYTHASLSAIWSFTPAMELRLTAHATDRAARNLFGRDNAGSRLEVAMQASF